MIKYYLLFYNLFNNKSIFSICEYWSKLIQCLKIILNINYLIFIEFRFIFQMLVLIRIRETTVVSDSLWWEELDPGLKPAPNPNSSLLCFPTV